MAGFLYFLPGETRKFTREKLDEVGLTYAFDRNPTSNGCRGGPDGKQGMVLASGDTKVGYYSDKQTWQRIPGNKADAWVGVYTDDQPKPDDLARSKIVAGHFVELGDGNNWLCPVARGLREEEDQLRWFNALPQGTGLDDKGNWTQTGVLIQHAKLWEIALAWWDSIQGAVEGESAADKNAAQSVTFDFAGLNDAALAALVTNYRLGKAEVVLLGLFTGECTPLVLGALIDWPTFTDWAKKNAEQIAAGSNIDDGRAADTEDTDQL